MRRPCPGRALRLLLPVAAAAVCAPLAAAPAAAHTALAGSNPAAGATVARPLVAVALAFNEPVTPDLARVVVTGPDGRDVAVGAARVSGATVTQVVGPLRVPGQHVVAYRVLADDGHPITGRLRFTASGAAVAGQTGKAGAAGQADAGAPAGATADPGSAGQVGPSATGPGGPAPQGAPAGTAPDAPPGVAAPPAGAVDAGPLVPLLVAALAAAGVALLVGAVRSVRRAGTPA